MRTGSASASVQLGMRTWVRRTGQAVSALALLALVGCSAASFPPSNETGITITLEADGGATLGVQVPSGDPMASVNEIAGLVFPGEEVLPADPRTRTSSFAQVRVARAFDTARPSFGFDAGQLARSVSSSGSVLLTLCWPSGVPVSVSSSAPPSRASGCLKWTLPSGSDIGRISIRMDPAAWRLWALGGVSILILIAGMWALRLLIAARNAWTRPRRRRAMASAAAAALLLVVWLRLASAAQQGAIDMAGHPVWLAMTVRILAVAALVGGLIAAVLVVVISLRSSVRAD